MNGRPETEQLLRAMLATALRRGQLFVTGGNSNLLPVEPFEKRLTLVTTAFPPLTGLSEQIQRLS